MNKYCKNATLITILRNATLALLLLSNHAAADPLADLIKGVAASLAKVGQNNQQTVNSNSSGTSGSALATPRSQDNQQIEDAQRLELARQVVLIDALVKDYAKSHSFSDQDVAKEAVKQLITDLRVKASLSILGNYQLGASDILLIQDNGGSACPALFYFVAISASGVTATPAFGICSDLVKVKQKGDVVSVIMPGYQGPFSSKADHVKAAKQKHVFLYKGGLLTENGKPVE